MPHLKLDPKATLADLAFNAEGPDDITDAFCFVVGYTTGEIRRRIKVAAEMTIEECQSNTADITGSYQMQLANIETAWEAFMAASNAQPHSRIGHTEGWVEQQREATKRPT